MRINPISPAFKASNFIKYTDTQNHKDIIFPREALTIETIYDVSSGNPEGKVDESVAKANGITICHSHEKPEELAKYFGVEDIAPMKECGLHCHDGF